MAVAAGVGQSWKEQKKFMLKNLANQGIGNKELMQDLMDKEADSVVETLIKLAGQPINSQESALN